MSASPFTFEDIGSNAEGLDFKPVPAIAQWRLHVENVGSCKDGCASNLSGTVFEECWHHVAAQSCLLPMQSFSAQDLLSPLTMLLQPMSMISSILGASSSTHLFALSS